MLTQQRLMTASSVIADFEAQLSVFDRGTDTNRTSVRTRGDAVLHSVLNERLQRKSEDRTFECFGIDVLFDAQTVA
jgi:hypothetical protein